MIILHIGFPKTGTTTLQRLFEAHNQELRDQSVCYPLIDDDFKQRYLKLFDHAQHHNRPESQAQLLKTMAKLGAHIAASGCKTTILSCEELNSMATALGDPANLARLRDTLVAIDTDITLVAYVRNPADFYLSILQERLKRQGHFVPPENFNPGFAARIATFEKVFGTKAKVRELSRSKLKQGSVVHDFLELCGLERIDPTPWGALSVNETLPAEVMLLLDVMRRTGINVDIPVAYNSKQQERLWRKLRDVARNLGISGKPQLFASARDAVLAGSAADCAALSDRYQIAFDPSNAVLDDTKQAPVPHLSPIERVTQVDRAKALAIWAQFSHQFTKL